MPYSKKISKKFRIIFMFIHCLCFIVNLSILIVIKVTLYFVNPTFMEFKMIKKQYLMELFRNDFTEINISLKTLY